MFFFNTGLFSPCIFCSFLHLQTILPHLEFAQWSYVFWEIIWNILQLKTMANRMKIKWRQIFPWIQPYFMYLVFSYGMIQYVDSSLWFVGLMAFRTYTIRVVAVNENGEGMSTREMTTKTYSDKPSEPPQNATLETASSTVRI